MALIIPKDCQRVQRRLTFLPSFPLCWPRPGAVHPPAPSGCMRSSSTAIGQAHIRSDRVKLLTRTGLDWTARFGILLAGTLADLPVGEAVIDGEVVAEGRGGAPNFSALQDALSTGRTDRLIFYAFDLLYLDGYDLRPALLVERKTALAALIPMSGMVRVGEHFEGDGK